MKSKKYSKPSKGGRDAQWGKGNHAWCTALAKYSGEEGCQVAAAEWLQTNYEGPNRYRGFLGQLVGMVEGWRHAG